MQKGECKVSKFIIRSCCNLMNSYCKDGKEVHDECGDSAADEKCCDVKNCYLKQIAESLLNVTRENLCNSCDGCGYDEGCNDVTCGTYAAYKSLDLLGIEFVEN